MLNVDFEDNGNDEYGLVFSRDSEYDPLPSFQFNDRGEVFIGLPDDDVSEQVRDVLNRRYPVDSRRQLGEALRPFEFETSGVGVCDSCRREEWSRRFGEETGIGVFGGRVRVFG